VTPRLAHTARSRHARARAHARTHARSPPGLRTTSPWRPPPGLPDWRPAGAHGPALDPGAPLRAKPRGPARHGRRRRVEDE
jgi:hypothetical protein